MLSFFIGNRTKKESTFHAPFPVTRSFVTAVVTSASARTSSSIWVVAQKSGYCLSCKLQLVTAQSTHDNIFFSISISIFLFRICPAFIILSAFSAVSFSSSHFSSTPHGRIPLPASAPFPGFSDSSEAYPPQPSPSPENLPHR